MQRRLRNVSFGVQLDADHPENGVLIPRRFTLELAREYRLDVARALHVLMCAQHPGRQVLLRQGTQVLRRSDEALLDLDAPKGL